MNQKRLDLTPKSSGHPLQTTQNIPNFKDIPWWSEQKHVVGEALNIASSRKVGVVGGIFKNETHKQNNIENISHPKLNCTTGNFPNLSLLLTSILDGLPARTAAHVLELNHLRGVCCKSESCQWKSQVQDSNLARSDALNNDQYTP